MAVSELQERLDELLPVLRSTGSDSQYVEVKDASGGFPASVLSSVSAFANGSGGLVILGLDEPEFVPTGADAEALARVLADRSVSNLEPAMHLNIEICQVDGQNVVVAEVDELSPSAKPCWVTVKNKSPFAYIRSHDGDRRLNSYEHHAIEASKSLPEEDMRPTPGTGLDDLDTKLVAGVLHRIRSSPGTRFLELDDLECLRMLGVLVDVPAEPDASEPVEAEQHREEVSLAGLLALGKYPQKHYPRLSVTFVSFATTNGEALSDGTRYLDNQLIEGSIPHMIEGVEDAIRRNTRRRAVVRGFWREDHWEYPIEAVRELVVNALLHRDYHSTAQSQPVKLALFPDRFEVSNPGGIVGMVKQEDLMVASVSASRNRRLARLLQDVPLPQSGRSVCENVGTGLLVVAQSLRSAGMAPPELDTSLTSFSVTLAAESVLDDASIEWLSELDRMSHGTRLSDRQRLGLAFIRRHGSIDNRAYRVLTDVNAGTATRDLVDLRDRELVVRTGQRRWASWTLAQEAVDGSEPVSESERVAGVESTPRIAPGSNGTRLSLDRRLSEVVEALGAGPMSSQELADRFTVSRNAVQGWLRALEERGQVRPTEAGRRSRFQRWELVGEGVR